MKEYNIKDVGGGTYSDGFFDALRFMHGRVISLKEQIKVLQYMRNKNKKD